MTVLELAKKYYPVLWPPERIEALRAAGRLTDGEYAEVVGDDTSADSQSDSTETSAET